MSLFEELKRRNVFRVGIAYTVLAWLVAQVGDLLLEAFGAPDWVLKTLLAMMLLGFPFVVFFAWAFELTPEGLKREAEVDRKVSITTHTGHKLNRAITLLLVLAVGYFAWDKYMRAAPEPGVTEPAAVAETAAGTEAAGEVESGFELPDDLSIAVLPLENRSKREEDEFFADGIHDDLLTQLAQIGALRVISRTSVAQFKGTTLSIREIAELLNVSSILEGGVQRAGNQVRINMQLIDAETDGHLWAATYDREMTANNIFRIQSEIAEAVTEAMRATLTPEEQSRMAAVPTESMEALELYFKGRAELDQRTLPAIESAHMRFKEARTIDPGFALAWAGESQAIQFLSDEGGSYGQIPLAEALDIALPLIERAYELAPDDPQVLGVYGLTENHRDNFERAEDFYQRSLAINPSSAEVMNWRRMNLYELDRFKEALDVALQMVEVDPMSMIGLFNAVLTIRRAPDHDPALVERLLVRLERLDKSFGLTARAIIASEEGKTVDAVRYGYASLEADPGRSNNIRDLSSTLLGLGLVDEARKVNPDLDAFQLAQANNNTEAMLRLAREEYTNGPDSTRARTRLINAVLAARSDPDEAMPAARQLWEDEKDKVAPNGFTLVLISWLAQQAEYPVEAQTWRDAAARRVQSVIETEVLSSELLREARFWMARLDGRDEEALALLQSLVEDNQFGGRFMAENAGLDSLRAYPEYARLEARVLEGIEADRRAVVDMLCGPDTILTTWEPATETCAGQ